MSRLARKLLTIHALSVAGGGAFAGAYDDTDLIALYAMRLGLTSYYGSPLIRVRRSSDNAEDDIGHLSNGDLDTAAVADFIGGGSALIITWYEQKNGNDATQSTATAQPLYVASGQNSQPVMRGDGSDDELVGPALNSILSNTGSLVIVATPLTIVSDNEIWVGGHETDKRFYFGQGASGNEAKLAGGFLDKSRLNLLSASDNLSAGTAVVGSMVGGSGGNAVIYLNSTSTDTEAVSGTFGTATFNLFHPSSLINYANVEIGEVVIANAAWSTAEREAAEQKAADYWGITLS